MEKQQPKKHNTNSIVPLDQKPLYFFKGPFRFVKPYQHTFQTHCKKRWLNQQLFTILCKQFLAYDQKYFLQAIKTARIKINHQKVQPTYILKNNDLLTHNTLRQEPPILNLDIKIVFQDQQLLVVEKPTSMIVHTGGGYHYNTLIKILEYEVLPNRKQLKQKQQEKKQKQKLIRKEYKNHKQQQLFVVHRLDRMTSGILIIAKKKEKANKFHQQNASQTIKKMYYARVGGNFKWEQIKLDKPIVCLSHKEGVYGVYHQEEQKKQKIEQMIKQPKKQKNKAHKDPNLIKDSVTIFKKVWYDQKSDSSLLQCYPITGRTHQIRVHLQFLGFSILNDIGYDGRFVGNMIIQYINKKNELFQKDQNLQDNQNKKQNSDQQQDDSYQKPRKKIKLNNGYDAQIKFPIQRWDYKQKPWEIYLHSYKYILQGKQYKCSKPYWYWPDFCIKNQEQQQSKKMQAKLNKNQQ